MRRPRLNALRTFEAAGRHLSFAAAAAELSITPPAVSQQIRQLEACLNASLFLRRGRRLSLTSAGQAYHETVHQVIERLDAVTDQLFPGQRHHAVTIRCTPSIAALWIVPRLGAFQKRHPEIDLSIQTLDLTHTDSGHRPDELEIMILHDPEARKNAELMVQATVTPVCSPALLPSGQPLDDAEALAGYTLIHVVGYDEDWHTWFRAFMPAKTTVPRGVRVDGSLIAMEMAARGEGVMLGRRPFIDSALKAGDLTEMLAGPRSLSSSYYLRRPSLKKADPARESVAQWLLSLAADDT